jgi:hypothetical protein
MTTSAISTYLNDHLAGSVIALELLDHMIGLKGPVNQDLLNRLRREIQEDQEVLRDLLKGLEEGENPVRKAAAWLSEKLGRAKLHLDDSGSGELRELEAFEALALGIQGKLSLWHALATVRDRVPQLAQLDLGRLQSRALDQYNQIERLRLEAARRALGG